MDADELKARIGGVDWRRYRQGPGPGDIGQWLGRLADGDAAVRTPLEHKLLPRDALSEAAYHAVPWLLAFVEARVAAELTYDLLVPVAASAAPDADDETIVVDGIDTSLVTASRAALARGADVYLRDATDARAAATVRTSAVLMLDAVVDRARWVEPIRACAAEEPDAGVRRTMLECL